ncbi:delta-class carbonic anhydrase [Litoreibacter sp.]|nr:delta-class carbonic anhydrase [Litoreibacter sp.]
MTDNRYTFGAILGIAGLMTSIALADGNATKQVGDDVITAQRGALAATTEGAGFGPQSPRDIEALAGTNTLDFENAPAYTRMNLCNIHFHEGAEHKGGEFTKYAGNGDGKGYGTGYVYSGELSAAELAPVDYEVGTSEHSALAPGDTVELHYVHTTAKITPGPTLGACLSDAIMNPQLRVEAQVFVLVNDDSAANFVDLMVFDMVEGFHQAVNMPNDTGTPVVYDGSTTGPSYNMKGSPLQVTWSVRPEVMKVSISSVAAWLDGNAFDEDHAHGVRNLVTNPALLSPIN